MHILVATSGVLSPASAVEFVSRLLDDGGHVTVTTVIEVPRTFLDDLRSERWHPMQHGSEPMWTLHDDAVVDRYVEERGRRICEPVVKALTASGIKTEAEYLEGEDPAATISGLANKLEVDMVVMGATRPIFDQSAWESVSARVTLECNKPVLVLPPPVRTTVPTMGEPDSD
ncbi:MAG TPA: universal stress protein [Acidimicrobiia bacterium]|jgi:nucleotide-binding universal stress UspA family protein|nr:universal stress protein [Acidimicrobiia bacterium]